MATKVNRGWFAAFPGCLAGGAVALCLLGGGCRRTAGVRPDEVGPQEPSVQQFSAEPEQWGGSWDTWEQALQPFRADVRRQLDERPAELQGLIGREGYIFYRHTLEYVVAGDLRNQPGHKDPYPAIVRLDEELSSAGIELLFAPVPTKAEVYPEMISECAPAGAKPYVTPHFRRFLRDLVQAGVEVVDLLPAFVNEREAQPEPLYLRQDTHWSNRAVRLTARLVADHIRCTRWFRSRSAAPIEYSVRPMSDEYIGGVVKMLSRTEQRAFKPEHISAQQVLCPDGTPYVDDPDSPVLLLGDSFANIYEFDVCQHAGFTAHLAKELGMPVGLIATAGGGPIGPAHLARLSRQQMRRKRIVIWMMVARDLYDSPTPWLRNVPVP